MTDKEYLRELYKYKDEYSVGHKQKYVFNYHGLDTQLDKLGEECLELALAIRHKDRPTIGLGNVIEEMADVLNLLEQIKNNHINIRQGIDRFRVYKVDRELSRIATTENRAIGGKYGE